MVERTPASGDIISNQLERGARRDFPVSGISFLGGHFPYEGRGDIGHHALMKGEETQATTHAPRILLNVDDKLNLYSLLEPN